MVSPSNSPSIDHRSLPKRQSGPVQTQTPTVSVTGPVLIQDCKVSDSNPDGSAFMTIYVRPDLMKRLRRRADKVPLGEYCWENIFKQALDSHCY